MTRRLCIFVLGAAMSLRCATARVSPRPPREASAQRVSVHEENRDAEVAEERFATKQAQELATKDRAAREEKKRRVEVEAKPRNK